MGAMFKDGNNFRFRDYLPIIFVVLLTAAVICFRLVYTKFYVVGSSMENTITGAYAAGVKGGDYVYIFEATPSRGDIVVVKTKGKNLIKRVIGLGGDTVELKAGVLYLNGEVKEEPYVSAEHNSPGNSNNTFGPVTVEEGYMFLMGDNRNVSNDSRSAEYGQIALDCVIGVVAEWSLILSDAVTSFNTFFDFTVPSLLGL